MISDSPDKPFFGKNGSGCLIVGLAYIACVILMMLRPHGIEREGGGLVVDSLGDPISNAQIHLYRNGGTNLTITLWTDWAGTYSFGGIRPEDRPTGSEDIREIVSKPGFRTVATNRSNETKSRHVLRRLAAPESDK